MQPQQQHAVAVPVQATYVVQPKSSVVTTYGSSQSTVIGILLIIAGALSVLCNVIDVAVGSDVVSVAAFGFRAYFRPSRYSYGVVGHGFWCGIAVSIINI